MNFIMAIFCIRSFFPLSLLAFRLFSAAAEPPQKTTERAQTCRSIGANLSSLTSILLLKSFQDDIVPQYTCNKLNKKLYIWEICVIRGRHNS